MQIRRFYCPELTATSVQVTLPDAEATHALRVLRLRAGDRLTLMNGNGITADAVIAPETTNHRLICNVEKISQTDKIFPTLILYVAPPHTKVFDQIIKAAVELGVAKIVPVITRYSTAKPDDKADAWQNTAIAAMKQSINPWLPEICPPMEFDTALSTSSSQGCFGATPHHDVKSTDHDKVAVNNEYAVWIGPEGGFCPEEEAALLSRGLTPISIGQYVLRVETAVPAMLAIALNNL